MRERRPPRSTKPARPQPARPGTVLPRPAARVPGHAGGPGRVRIIGGVWKRSLLPVPDLPGLRPTPDRIRETLFNWLGQDLSGACCLDLFAGSGALGFEAASRGARRVVLIEQDPRIVRMLEAGVERLNATQVEVLQADAIGWLEAAGAGPERFDLVFLDPPFGQGWLAKALPALGPLLAPAARVYVESDAPIDAPPPQMQLLRHAKAGQVHYHLFEATAPVSRAHGALNAC